MSTQPTSPPPHAAKDPAGRRWTVRILLIVATILAVLSILAVWANRQVLSSSNWADTSTQLLADQHIRDQVSATLVDTLYANVDVQGQVAAALPQQLKPLAGPAASGLRDLAQRVTNEALGRPRFQEAWRAANRVTAQQFINIAEGKSGAVTASGGAVVLDLRVLLVNLVRRLGLPGRLVGEIPPGAGRIKILRSDQVTTVQNGASALKGLSLVLPALALALLALAVWLSHARRRRTLLFAGIDLVIAGLIVLIARHLIGNHVVNSLATTDAVRPAAAAAWDIGSHMLRDIAQAVIISGIPVILAAWLAGPTRLAVRLRRAMAPVLRDRADVSYGVLGVILLAIVAWGPIPATRKVIPVLIMIALAAVGLEVLRRQTAVEFPDVQSGGIRFPNFAAMRSRHTVTREGNGAAHAVPAEPGRVDQLERLSALHAQGALSDAEFAAEKAGLGARPSVT